MNVLRSSSSHPSYQEFEKSEESSDDRSVDFSTLFADTSDEENNSLRKRRKLDHAVSGLNPFNSEANPQKPAFSHNFFENKNVTRNPFSTPPKKKIAPPITRFPKHRTEVNLASRKNAVPPFLLTPKPQQKFYSTDLSGLHASSQKRRFKSTHSNITPQIGQLLIDLNDLSDPAIYEHLTGKSKKSFIKNLKKFHSNFKLYDLTLQKLGINLLDQLAGDNDKVQIRNLIQDFRDLVTLHRIRSPQERNLKKEIRKLTKQLQEQQKILQQPNFLLSKYLFLKKQTSSLTNHISSLTQNFFNELSNPVNLAAGTAIAYAATDIFDVSLNNPAIFPTIYTQLAVYSLSALAGVSAAYRFRRELKFVAKCIYHPPHFIYDKTKIFTKTIQKIRNDN